MAAQRSPQEIVQEVIRETLNEPGMSLEAALAHPLAKSLLKALAPKSATAVAASLSTSLRVERRSLADSATSPSAITAAINDTFILPELPADDGTHAVLLDTSDLVMIDGQRRLRLRDTARAELLKRAIDREPYISMLRDAVRADEEQHTAVGRSPIHLPSAWLRCFLSGSYEKQMTAAPVKELKAALCARERLRYVEVLQSEVPSIADLSRRLGLAELLEPLRLLIGEEGGWDGTPRRDRFVGRDDELKRLRGFVDELASKGYVEAVIRALRPVVDVATGRERPDVVVIVARGGLGKSTLLAKFVIDHAVQQSRPFPFAYLDFDRAGIDPARPTQLLMEIARQVGLQFPSAEPQLTRLADDIRAVQVDPAAGTSNIKDPFAQFAEILRGQITHGQRAFLVVLDTLETVQWNSSAMEMVAGLLDEFRRKGLDEMRVVASGRADVPELRKSTDSKDKPIELKPLSPNEARNLARALGRATLGKEWNDEWPHAIVGDEPVDSPSSEMRREPLAIRVAVDLIARTDPVERREMVDQIRKEGLDASDDFVARLYEKRILNHVRDSKAQRLAWPGLVVRRLTIEIVRELAPLCGLGSDDAEAAFKALGQEIWIVDRVDGAGTVLRHRPDLRSRTLPLMRRKAPERFNAINQKAIEYFGRYRNRSEEDYAEWIYHRMLADESMSTIERDLRPKVMELLATARDDFAPNSAAASYVFARTETKRMAPWRISALQPADALHHLRVTSASAFAFDDAELDRVVADVAERVGRASVQVRSEQEPWARALWIKTGAWQRIDVTTPLPREATPVLRAHLFWLARMSPRWLRRDDEREQLLQDEVASVAHDPNAGFRTTVQALAMARLTSSPSFHVLDARAAEMLTSMKPNPLPSMQAALRTAIVLGENAQLPAVRLWLETRSRGTQDRVRTPTFALAELSAIARIMPNIHESLAKALDTKEPQRIADEVTVRTALRAIEELTAELKDVGAEQSSQYRRALALIFAQRSEDWVVPFGYAAARANPNLSAAVIKRLREFTGGKGPTVTDTLTAMRLADEAGDLTGCARQFLEENVSLASATDLVMLLECHQAWSDAINTVIDTMHPEMTSVSVEPQSDMPPPPGPVLHEDDPQKDRWGGRSGRDGRAASIVLESVESDIFYFSVVVQSTDDSELTPPVIFHLHDSYPKSVQPIRRIHNGQAVLRDWNAYGVFAIGVQVKTGAGRWTSLEVDLRDLAELPKRFLKR
jgi:hypothetical protein